MRNFEFIKSALGDNYVQRFNYDIFGQKIEVYYEGYFNANEGKYQETPCVFTIKGWKESYRIPYNIDKPDMEKCDLDNHMGIFFMIMGIEKESNFFKITINTIDDRYVSYYFEDPELSIVEINNKVP